MLDVPVILVAFNRPDLTSLVLDRIREAAPTKLFLIADGPRSDHADDGARCAAVRRLLESPGWPCSVQRRYSSGNHGCEATIELGLDWVFEQADRAIVFEDDCVPDLTFFRFCEELLTRYQDDPRVMHIGGCNLLATTDPFGDGSYAFTRFAPVWGWATWRRAWKSHRARFSRGIGRPWSALEGEASTPVDPRSFLLGTAARRYYSAVATLPADHFSWDSHWWLSLVTSDGLAVAPARNLVENTGFRKDATHTISSRSMLPASPMHFPLVHPRDTSVNKELEEAIELVLARYQGRLSGLARRVIPPGRVRGLASSSADLGMNLLLAARSLRHKRSA